jgi:GR25 family glycosyltransferase involved in LPS biosynthesis
MITGYYINLDNRPDRREHIERLKANFSFFSNIERFPAIANANGGAGCAMSHVTILEMLSSSAGETDQSYVMVIEDDLHILNEMNFHRFVSAFDKIKDSDAWDIIVLTPRGKRTEVQPDADMNAANFYRIQGTQTATGYIIKRRFIPTLLNNWKEALHNLLRGGSYAIYAIDQWWKPLQDKYSFYYNIGLFAGQLPGYSNIEKQYVDYNIYFAYQR